MANGALGAAGAPGATGASGATAATGATGAAGIREAPGRASSPGYSLIPGKTSGLGAGVMGTGKSALALPLVLREVGACEWRSERGQARLESERTVARKAAKQKNHDLRIRACQRRGRQRALLLSFPHLSFRTLWEHGALSGLRH